MAHSCIRTSVTCIHCSCEMNFLCCSLWSDTIDCCRNWDVDLLDALLPQLLPKLHSNVIRPDDVNWKLAAVQGFLFRFHLQVYHQLSQTLVMPCTLCHCILYSLYPVCYACYICVFVCRTFVHRKIYGFNLFFSVFMPLPCSVAGAIMFFCVDQLCVHACMHPETLSAKCIEKYWDMFSPNLQHYCILGQRWRLRNSYFGVRRSKFKVMME